jgi:hypothetical protein
MSETPDETRLWLREQLARIDQLQADGDRRRQETALALRHLRAATWKAAAALLTVGAALFAAGAAFVRILG